MFYDNYKWSINFKNCESLYTKSVTYNIIHQSYFSKYKQEKKKVVILSSLSQSFPPLICLESSFLSFKMLTLLGIIPSNRSPLVCREWILILYSFCILRIYLLLDTTIFVSICSFQAETQSYLCFHPLELIHLTESELHKYLLSRNELHIFSRNDREELKGWCWSGDVSCFYIATKPRKFCSDSSFVGFTMQKEKYKWNKDK